MDVDRDQFYDRKTIAFLPMAFCFPGYDAKGSDLPPPAICAQTWHAQVMKALPNIRLTLILGGYAQKYHLGTKTLTKTVEAWQDYAPQVFPLPHPSWRNTAWIKRNPWFAKTLVPALQEQVKAVLR